MKGPRTAGVLLAATTGVAGALTAVVVARGVGDATNELAVLLAVSTYVVAHQVFLARNWQADKLETTLRARVPAEVKAGELLHFRVVGRRKEGTGSATAGRAGTGGTAGSDGGSSAAEASRCGASSFPPPWHRGRL